MAPQSDSKTEPPVAVAILHLEDGTSFVGKSFGCHKAVEGEVCFILFISCNNILNCIQLDVS
jgi:hypothetical protein